MKNGRSLEEQRKALLEQIHASRAVYRRMLTGETAAGEIYETAGSGQSASTAAASVSATDPYFPRSTTMQWVTQHPYAAAIAIAGVALLLPKTARLASRTAGSAFGRKKKVADPYSATPAATLHPHMQQPVAYAPYAGNGYPQPIYIQQPTSKKTGVLAGIAAFGGTALTSIITIATMVLRDPAKMQMAMRFFSTASHYVQNRRTQPPAQPR